MHIGFSSDDNYAQHLGVAITGLLLYLDKETIPQIYVVDGGISAENKAKIAELKSLRDFSIVYLHVDASAFADFPLTGNYTVATYYRLLLPQLLPAIDKILYLDVDIVILDDLLPLYQTILSPDQWLGAVYEPDVDFAYTSAIGLTPEDLYFNAGVMLVNLAALRNVDLVAQSKVFVLRYHAHMNFVDQDILNNVCRGHISPIDPRYNMFANFADKRGHVNELSSIYDLQTLDRAIEQPAIVHFVGYRKPWLYRCDTRFSEKYMQYIGLTPWHHYRYPDKNIRTMTSKGLNKLHKFVRYIKG